MASESTVEKTKKDRPRGLSKAQKALAKLKVKDAEQQACGVAGAHPGDYRVRRGSLLSSEDLLHADVRDLWAKSISEGTVSRKPTSLSHVVSLEELYKDLNAASLAREAARKAMKGGR